MKNMPPKELFKVLNENKNSIYVFVPVGDKRRSIRVSYSEAMDWVINVAKENHGDVPYSIQDHEVFLGL